MQEIRIPTKSECFPPARRSFLKKSGAALSGALAAIAVGSAKATTANTDEGLALRLAKLEDANAVRKVYLVYESAINQGRYEDAWNLFAADSEVSFGGGIFSGKDQGVRRLYLENFRQGLTGKKVEMSGTTVDMTAENIETAADRKSAKAAFPYSMRVGTPMDASLQLVQMARLHGGGILHWGESGHCEAAFVKEGENWKISRIEYRSVQPGNAARFTKTYPENAIGPDSLV